METKISAKGQIVIPARLQRKYGMKAVTKIHVYEDGVHIVLKPVTPEFYRNLRGSLKRKKALKALLADRAMEKES